METTDPRPWYKKKRYLVPLGILGLVMVAGVDGSTTAPTTTQVSPTALVQPLSETPSQNTPSAKATVQQPAQTYTGGTNLSNDNYYTNSAGNTVHSPAYSDSVPAGASAQCRDGTYSFSQSRRGTCSHHGGVAEWL